MIFTFRTHNAILYFYC